jgi:hypothetical protein
MNCDDNFFRIITEKFPHFLKNSVPTYSQLSGVDRGDELKYSISHLVSQLTGVQPSSVKRNIARKSVDEAPIFLDKLFYDENSGNYFGNVVELAIALIDWPNPKLKKAVDLMRNSLARFIAQYSNDMTVAPPLTESTNQAQSESFYPEQSESPNSEQYEMFNQTMFNNKNKQSLMTLNCKNKTQLEIVNNQGPMFSGSTSTTIFGNPPPPSMLGNQAPPSMFGNPAPPSMFGNPPPPSIFGNPAPQPMCGKQTPPNIFGNPPPSSMFGNPHPPSIFGTPAPPPMCGKQTPPNIFGNPSPSSMFGNPHPPSIFGNPPTPSMFGTLASQKSFSSQCAQPMIENTTPSSILGTQDGAQIFNFQQDEPQMIFDQTSSTGIIPSFLKGYYSPLQSSLLDNESRLFSQILRNLDCRIDSTNLQSTSTLQNIYASTMDHCETAVRNTYAQYYWNCVEFENSCGINLCLSDPQQIFHNQYRDTTIQCLDVRKSLLLNIIRANFTARRILLEEEMKFFQEKLETEISSSVDRIKEKFQIKLAKELEENNSNYTVPTSSTCPPIATTSSTQVVSASSSTPAVPASSRLCPVATMGVDTIGICEEERIRENIIGNYRTNHNVGESSTGSSDALEFPQQISIALNELVSGADDVYIASLIGIYHRYVINPTNTSVYVERLRNVLLARSIHSRLNRVSRQLNDDDGDDDEDDDGDDDEDDDSDGIEEEPNGANECTLCFPRCPTKSSEIIEQCSICLVDIKKGSTVYEIGCPHTYHQDCLEKWIKENNSCPNCRKYIPVFRFSMSDETGECVEQSREGVDGV